MLALPLNSKCRIGAFQVQEIGPWPHNFCLSKILTDLLHLNGDLRTFAHGRTLPHRDFDAHAPPGAEYLRGQAVSTGPRWCRTAQGESHARRQKEKANVEPRRSIRRHW